MPTPGGGASATFQKIVNGDESGEQWINAVLFLSAIYAVVWLPIRRRRFGLSIYAIGSNRNAAFLSGVNVVRVRRRAYALAGVLVALGGLAITANVGAADARETLGGLYTLNSVGAVVLGGVALTGGVGGLIGPMLAAFCTQLIQTVMINKGVDQNWADVWRNVLIIAVVAFGGYVQRRKTRPQ
jgi:ribose transport system permease protein